MGLYREFIVSTSSKRDLRYSDEGCSFGIGAGVGGCVGDGMRHAGDVLLGGLTSVGPGATASAGVQPVHAGACSPPFTV